MTLSADSSAMVRLLRLVERRVLFALPCGIQNRDRGMQVKPWAPLILDFSGLIPVYGSVFFYLRSFFHLYGFQFPSCHPELYIFLRLQLLMFQNAISESWWFLVAAGKLFVTWAAVARMQIRGTFSNWTLDRHHVVRALLESVSETTAGWVCGAFHLPWKQECGARNNITSRLGEQLTTT